MSHAKGAHIVSITLKRDRKILRGKGRNFFSTHYLPIM